MGDNSYIPLVTTIQDQFNQLCRETKEIELKKIDIVQKLSNNVQDFCIIEKAGIELTLCLKKLKQKIFTLLDSLEKTITQTVSGKHNIKLDKLSKAIAECQQYDGIAVNKNFPAVIFESATNETINSSDQNKDNILKNKLSLSLINHSSLSQETDDEGWVDSCSKILNVGR